MFILTVIAKRNVHNEMELPLLLGSIDLSHAASPKAGGFLFRPCVRPQTVSLLCQELPRSVLRTR